MTGPSDFELLAAVLLVCAGAACLVWAILAPFRAVETDEEEALTSFHNPNQRSV